MAPRGTHCLLALLAIVPTANGFVFGPLSGDPPDSSSSEPADRFRGKYRGRLDSNLLEGQLRSAREAGLDWLVKHQDDSGVWFADQFHRRCGDDPCGGPGKAEHSLGVTGLALLAFLAAGHSADTGGYQSVVKQGLEALVRSQNRANGCLGSGNLGGSYLYSHAIATQALVEGYGLSERPDLRRAAQRAVDLILRARNLKAGWRYMNPPNGSTDTSMTGWMVAALRAADDFGLEVAPDGYQGALDFLDACTSTETWRTGYIDSGGYSARTPDASSAWPPGATEAMTASALLCRLNCGQSPAASPALARGAGLISLSPPRWNVDSGCIDYYYWFHGTYALHWLGGKQFDDWEAKLHQVLLDHQAQRGHAQGSWDPTFGPWGTSGGRVYATALLTLCLSVRQRYDHSPAARVERFSGSPPSAAARKTRFSEPLELLLAEYDRSRGNESRLLSVQKKLARHFKRKKGAGDSVIALLYSGYALAEAGELDMPRRPRGAAERFTLGARALQAVMESGSTLEVDGETCFQRAASLRLDLHQNCVAIYRQRLESEESYGEIDFKNHAGYHLAGIELCKQVLGKPD